ncbi:hypothetical protein CN918_29890 [Priestia megaterium]|nr:hypothetical protein CN918_29890 [Priestia megaterium]
MKVEIEVKAFGEEQVVGASDGYKGMEISRTHDLPKETTVEEVRELANSLVEEVKKIYPNPEQIVAKAAIRLHTESGRLVIIE